MGIVSDYLHDLILKQVNEKGLVVWFDPDGHYCEFARGLVFDKASVACYAGSFFALRHQIEPLLDGDQVPRLVVYVPLGEEQTQNALIELTSAGVVLKPGQSPWQRNTRLSVIAAHALLGQRNEADLAAIAKQVDAGQLSLADLDRLAEGSGIPGVLTIIFDTGDPEEIALLFLTSDRYDAEIKVKKASAELVRALNQTYGIQLRPNETPEEIRARLARYILGTEFLASLRGAPPSQLVAVPIAPDGPAREACVQLARTWRLRRDMSDSYVPYAERTEQELGVAALPLDLDQIRDCETFAALEQSLQSAVELAMLEGLLADPLAIAQRRRSGFWPSLVPEMQARWALIVTIGDLLDAAGRLAEDLRDTCLDAPDILHHYTGGDHPWCELDTLHRELEYRWGRFDPDARHTTLVQLIEHTRQRYVDAASTVAEQYLHALADARFQLPGVFRQREIYARTVAPALRAGKTAYILVDALRFEMARELATNLAKRYSIQLSAAIGTVPTITPIGMAALMPGADSGVQVVTLPKDKLALEIGATVLRDRKSRMAWLKAHAGVVGTGSPAKVYDTTLEALLQSTPSVVSEIGKADLILVTSQEIDQICEQDNILMARGALDDILTNLQRAIHRLAAAGCQTIVFTADHGFVFAGELSPDMKLDPPGGNMIDLHRRVWIGRGGAKSAAYLRAPLAAFGLSDDPTLEIAVPWGLAGFKVPGGARAYFHGGMSPQEMVIPVAVLTPVSTTPMSSPGDIEWTLVLGSKEITTRFCSVRIGGQIAGLFDVAPPGLRVEVRLKAAVLSTPVSASYGFVDATRDVQMQFEAGERRILAENIVTLAITQDVPQPATVMVHLLDATTGRELARLDAVEMNIAF